MPPPRMWQSGGAAPSTYANGAAVEKRSVSSDSYPRTAGHQQANIAKTAASLAARQASAVPFPVVGIGASAGGVQALEAFFASIDADSGMAYVVVQHLSPDHTSLLHEILSRVSAIPVKQIEDGDAIKVDHAYVIAPGTRSRCRGTG